MWSDNGIIRPSPKIIVNTKRTYSPWNNSWGTFSRTPDTWNSGWICYIEHFVFHLMLSVRLCLVTMQWFITIFPTKEKNKLNLIQKSEKRICILEWDICILIKLVLHWCSVLFSTWEILIECWSLVLVYLFYNSSLYLPIIRYSNKLKIK